MKISFGLLFVAYGLYGISNVWIQYCTTEPTLFLKGGVLLALGIVLIAWSRRR